MKEIDESGQNVIVDGVPYYTFSCEYVTNDGKEWSFNIFAKDWQDADERIKAIKLTVRNSGQVIEMFPFESDWAKITIW